ncbi:TPA: hypothetical protein ACH3X3_010280 [Trebouxia sp. C0006]
MENGNTYDYDLVTIGAGSGGTRASRFSAQHYGAKVAIVELPFRQIADDDHGGAGGTCVIRGCVPKKLLVYGAQFSEEFRDSTAFGWENGHQHNFDWKMLIAKKAKEITRLNNVYNKLLKDAGCERVEGKARLVDRHTVEVTLPDGGKRRLTTKNILLAQGGRPIKADVPGKEHAITSNEALSMPDLPKGPVVVVGAGYISLEFSGIYNGMGKDVHLFYRKTLPLVGFDEECRSQVAENMKKRGVHIYSEHQPIKLEKKEDGSIDFFYKGPDGRTKSMNAGLVLFGTGRKPIVHDMGLEDVGVGLDKDNAIKVDPYSRTTVDNIWSVGDVTNRMPLTPAAIMEGMAFAATCFGNKPTTPIFDKIASAVFIKPPLATCGLTEQQAQARLTGDIDIFVSKFKPMKNTLSGRDEKTFMKIIVKVDTDEVIGCHMVGDDAPEIMQGIAIAMKCNATKAQFDATVGIHPTAAEELVTMRQRARRIQGSGTGRGHEHERMAG